MAAAAELSDAPVPLSVRMCENRRDEEGSGQDKLDLQVKCSFFLSASFLHPHSLTKKYHIIPAPGSHHVL